MKSVLTHRPKALISALTAVTMLALCGMAWWARAPLLQGHGRLLVTQPERAAILDSQDTPLAWSTPELSVWVHLKAFASQKAATPKEAPEAMAKLASLLKIPPDQLAAKLTEPGEAAWLARHAEVRLARELQGGQQALVLTDLNEGWREDITPRLSALAVFPAEKPQWTLAFTLTRPEERDAAAWVKRSRQFMNDSLTDLAGQHADHDLTIPHRPLTSPLARYWRMRGATDADHARLAAGPGSVDLLSPPDPVTDETPRAR
jgi:hypothetical protein